LTTESKASTQTRSCNARYITPASVETELHEHTPDLVPFQQELIEALDIPRSLLGQSNVVDIRIAYAKYSGFITAQEMVFQMVRDKTWKLKFPNTHELRAIFISKSSWYGGYKLFSKLDKHSDMKKWLEGDPTIGNVELWGTEKGRYTFTDLGNYLEENGDASVGSKEKGKGKGKGKDKRKAAGSVSEGTDKKREKKKKKKKAPQIDQESSGS
jgi:hypothetical protein